MLAAMPSISMVQLLLLCGAALILYVTGRLTLNAIPGRIDRPTLRALISTSTVLAVTLAAILAGRHRIGLHLPIAAAACAMTFGVAALILGRPTSPDSTLQNRSWALLTPAVALLLIGGWVGRLDALLIASLGLFGALALLAWRDDPRPPARPKMPAAPDALAVDPATNSAASSVTPPAAHVLSAGAWVGLWWTASVALACLAGVLAVLGVPGLESAQRWSADPLVAVFLLAPAIVVPMFFELLPPCRTIGWGGSMSVLAKFALMNVCFVLPIASLLQANVSIVQDYLAPFKTTLASLPAGLPGLSPTTAPATTATTLPATMLSSPPATLPTSPPATPHAVAHAASVGGPVVQFPDVPGAAMRADVLVLAGAALLLMPFAAGWLRPGRLEAFALLGCYLLNLFLVMAAVVR